MTSPTPTQPPLPSPPPASVAPVVNPTPDSRLDQLAAEHALLTERIAPLADRLDEVKKAIKTELRSAFPSATEILLTSPHLPRPLSLMQVSSWRLETSRLKEEQPQIYVEFAKRSTSWRLAPTGG